MSEPRVWLADNGIICVDFGPNGRVTLEAVRAGNHAHRQLDLQPRPVLMLAKKIVYADYQAQRYASSSEVCEVVSAMGIVVDSFLARHLGNMFMAYHQPPYPTRVFKTEELAIAWLLRQTRPQRRQAP